MDAPGGMDRISDRLIDTAYRTLHIIPIGKELGGKVFVYGLVNAANAFLYGAIPIHFTGKPAGIGGDNGGRLNDGLDLVQVSTGRARVDRGAATRCRG